MKKTPHKRPCELHDPHLDVPQWGHPLDLSDGPVNETPSVLPQPERPPEITS